MLGFLWLGSEGLAAPEEPSEEIIVYGDDFARWDHTRWLVTNQLLLPLGATFSSERSLSFFTHALQLRAIVLCDKDGRLSRKKWEVSCEIEDFGIQVTTDRKWRRERDRQTVEAVLDEVDAKLTGMKVQMQVDDSGGITNFDLEGLAVANETERTIQEALRQVVSRMMAGFHLRIPDHAQRSGQWVEYRSELMDLPSLTASRGATTMVHQVSVAEGLQIVQTLGEGSVAVSLPNYAREEFAPDLVMDAAAAMPEVGEAPTMEAVTLIRGVGPETEIELTYALRASGVAVFRKVDGIMSERVWLVTGTPTASSGGGTATAPFENAGRITMLGEDDHPAVGPSNQVSWPGRQVEGLDPWVSLEAPALE